MVENRQTPSTSEPEVDPVIERRRFPARILGAVRLDADVFEEVEHHPAAIWQAAVIVGAAGLARGLAAVTAGEPPGFLGSVVIAYLSWVVVSGLIWLVGVVIDRDTSTFFELLRTIGFAAAPIVLLLVGVLPALVVPASLMVVGFAVHALAAAALVIAARQALDVSTLRAAVICGIVVGILTVLIAYLLHGLAVHLEGMIDLAVSAAVDRP